MILKESIVKECETFFSKNKVNMDFTSILFKMQVRPQTLRRLKSMILKMFVNFKKPKEDFKNIILFALVQIFGYFV